MKTVCSRVVPTRFVTLLGVLTAGLFVLAGCFGSDGADETAQAASEAKNAFQAMSEMGKQMEEMGKKMEEQKNRTVEPVDFRKLRELLPETVGDLERTNMEGQKGGAMGVSISTAEATYEGEERRRLTIKIADLGAVSGFAMFGYGWAMADIDRESSSGYEKTTEYEGHKAHEKYNRDSRRGEMQVLVADRFVVEVEGRDVEMETVKNALAQVNLDALVDMKDEGVQEGEGA